MHVLFTKLVIKWLRLRALDIVLQEIQTIISGFHKRNGKRIVSPSGGAGAPLYKLSRYVPPHQVGFLRRFGLKMGIHFAHFGLESSMVSEGTMGLYECLYHFNSR